MSILCSEWLRWMPKRWKTPPLFLPHRADRKPDLGSGPTGVSVTTYAQTFCDISQNPMQICLPQELDNWEQLQISRVFVP